jgi:hypothetical protein
VQLLLASLAAGSPAAEAVGAAAAGSLLAAVVLPSPMESWTLRTSFTGACALKVSSEPGSAGVFCGALRDGRSRRGTARGGRGSGIFSTTGFGRRGGRASARAVPTSGSGFAASAALEARCFTSMSCWIFSSFSSCAAWISPALTRCSPSFVGSPSSTSAWSSCASVSSL